MAPPRFELYPPQRKKVYTLIHSNNLFPRDSQDGLEIFDPSTGKNTWYETYHPDRSTPYSARARELLSNTLDREWCRQETSDSAWQEDTEDGDDYEDFAEELPSGVQDIIITGEVSLSPLSPPIRSSTAGADVS